MLDGVMTLLGEFIVMMDPGERIIGYVLVHIMEVTIHLDVFKTISFTVDKVHSQPKNIQDVQ